MLKKPILHLPLYFDFDRFDVITPANVPPEIKEFYSTEANDLEGLYQLKFESFEIARNDLEGFDPDNIAVGVCFALPGLESQVLCLGVEITHHYPAKRSTPKRANNAQIWILPSRLLKQNYFSPNHQMVVLNREEKIIISDQESCINLKNLYWFKESAGFSKKDLNKYKMAGMPFIKKWLDNLHWKKLYQSQPLFCDKTIVFFGPSKLKQLALCLQESLAQTNSENCDNELVKKNLKESMAVVEKRLNYHLLPIKNEEEQESFQTQFQKTGWLKSIESHLGEWATILPFLKDQEITKSLRRFEAKRQGADVGGLIGALRNRDAQFIVRLNAPEKKTKKAIVASKKTAFILNDECEFGFESELYKKSLLADVYFDSKKEALAFIKNTAELQGVSVNETVNRVSIKEINRLDPDYAYLVFNEEFNEGMKAMTALTGQDFTRFMGYTVSAAP